MLVSIIVPVYNAENTLRKCIDSVLSQGCDNIELLLVNDGSKDRSLEICREYEAQDERVVVIDKSNGGVSSARNAGLDVAQGEWVLFVDADDYLEENFFDGVEGASVELLIRGEKSFSEDGRMVSGCSLDSLSPQPTLAELVKRYVGTPLLRAPWTKFFRRSLIGDLRFPEDMKVGEDSYFVQRYLARCSNYRLLYGSCYHVNVGEPIEQKYACTVDYAAQSLLHLMESYKEMESHLHVGWSGFWSFYGFFKLVSKKNWMRSPWLWFCHPEIEKICRHLWPALPISQRAQYAVCHLFKLFR